MRLSKNQIETLKKSIFEITTESRVYLFGSRADKNAKGGDIDILVESHYPFKLKDIFKIKKEFWNLHGEQKLDIVCFTPEDDSPFNKLARLNAIEL